MSTGAAAIDAFLDREAAVAAVTAYADALDARDWGAYRALFTDRIAIDYGAIGSLVPLPADFQAETLRPSPPTNGPPAAVRSKGSTPPRIACTISLPA